MLRDLTGQKKIDKEAIMAAINSLQAKGFDVNPYTVADEAKISRSLLYRNSELMDLIPEARRSLGSGPGDEGDVIAEQLKQHNLELEDRIEELERENQMLVKNQQASWQEGYWAAIKQFSGMQESNMDIADNGSMAGEQDADELQVKSLDETDLNGQAVSQSALRDLIKHRLDKEEQVVEKQTETVKKTGGTKFVGAHKAGQDQLPMQGFVLRSVPPDIRKACLVLGIRPEELTQEIVHQAWKKEITNPGGHPDIGGETEIAVYLNTAKDTLYRFLDSKAPKLGKQFGSRAHKSMDESVNDESADEI